jgi:anti-anti-sigma factor
MEMTVKDAPEGATVVELDGRFDIVGAQQVDSRFTGLAEGAKALIVDVSKVPFIASLGVRTLMVSAKTLMRRGAYMAVVGASEGVEAVLRSTGFDELVGLHPDIASAIASYKRRETAFANRKA